MLEQHQILHLFDGRHAIFRNDNLPERTVQTGLGPYRKLGIPLIIGGRVNTVVSENLLTVIPPSTSRNTKITSFSVNFDFSPSENSTYLCLSLRELDSILLLI